MISRLLLTALFFALIAGSASAQIEDRLAINVGLPDEQYVMLCDSDEARTFYDGLDDAQGLLDSIPDIGGAGSETMWLNSFYRWMHEQFVAVGAGPYCLPQFTNLMALMQLMMYRVGEQYIGNAGEVEAERLLPLMHEMARLDLPRLNAGPVPPNELVLNQPFMQIPYCNVEQARAFYDTVDGYSEQFERLELVDDVRSLSRWVASFQKWVATDWSPFYEHPCGAVLLLVYIGEAMAYAAGVSLGALPMNIYDISDAMIAVRHFRAVDQSIIELAADYDLMETADGTSEQPHILEAAADLYATFRAPDVQIVQALVDAYLNRDGDSDD